MVTLTAVLVDTVSIQRYIFGSNKLKENIGASYIIEQKIYGDLLQQCLPDNFPMTHWKNNPNDILPSGFNIGIGYIGGGNALLLFNNKKDADKFINEFSLRVLLAYPGIKLAFGRIDDFAPTNFQDGRKRLQQSIINNRNLYTVNVLPFKHGIVDDCPLSNEAQEVFHQSSGKHISKMSAIKFDECKEAQQKLIETYQTELKNKYIFTDELDQLSQQEDKGYIAVVHVDGNGMGQRFIECEDLPALRKLSSAVSNLADTAMTQLIGHVVDLFEQGKLNEENGFKLNEYQLTKEEEKDATDDEKLWKNEKRKILPIRPIIVGGDDITFVCEGRLGVHLAEKLIEFMTKTDVDGKTISACGGVAVVHTKYPFYRAYQLSEELTKQAKEKSRTDNSSWLSFLISSGGFSGTLEEVQKQLFETPNGNLYYGPYRLGNEQPHLITMKENIKKLTTTNAAWPRSKLMALRDVLRKDTAEIDYFIVEAKSRNRKLPEYNGTKVHENLWHNKKTPYYDIIELMDFYPKELL